MSKTVNEPGIIVGENMVEFLPPGYYIKFWDRTQRKFRYYLLTEREGPLKYPYTFSALARDTKCDLVTFDDHNPAKNHVYQIFLGLRPGFRLYLWLPYDMKVLKLDEAEVELEIDKDAVALEYRDSPYEDPKFNFWVFRDKYEGIEVKNLMNRTIRPQVIFLIAKYTYEEITKENNPDLYDKLERNIVPSTPIFTGGIA